MSYEILVEAFKVIGPIVSAYYYAKLKGKLRTPVDKEATIPLEPLGREAVEADLMKEIVRLRSRVTQLERMAVAGTVIISQYDMNTIKSQMTEIRHMLFDITRNPSA